MLFKKVTPVDDYKNGNNILSGVRLPLNLANQNNVDIPRHDNMSLLRFKSSVDSCAATYKTILLHYIYLTILYLATKWQSDNVYRDQKIDFTIVNRTLSKTNITKDIINRVYKYHAQIIARDIYISMVLRGKHVY